MRFLGIGVSMEEWFDSKLNLLVDRDRNHIEMDGFHFNLLRRQQIPNK